MYSKIIYYIDADEIPGFLLLLKNHIFTTRSEDTIKIVSSLRAVKIWFLACEDIGYLITIALLAQARGRLILNFIHKMTSRCEDGRVIEFFSY